MANDATKYFMGDIYVGETSTGFLVSDDRGEAAETSINEETARDIVNAVEGKVDGPLKPASLFDISAEEFERFRDVEIPSSGLPDGVQVWQVKR